MPRPIHFEIHAEDPVRAQSFYSQLFGWEFTAWGPPGQKTPPYWLIRTGTQTPGIDGGLLPRHGLSPEDGQGVNAFVCTVDVPNVDDSTVMAERLGGSVAMAKMAIPGVGWLTYIKDTEGNILGLMASDPAAS